MGNRQENRPRPRIASLNFSFCNIPFTFKGVALKIKPLKHVFFTNTYLKWVTWVYACKTLLFSSEKDLW